MNEHWQETWQQHLPEIKRVYQESGEPAYGVYAHKLFSPLEAELKQAGLTSEQGLPGGFAFLASLTDFERRASRHPVFLLQSLPKQQIARETAPEKQENVAG
jgi:hypothetical protein